MTQIIGLLTPDSVMLAADRLLTWVGGPDDGKVFKGEECKLVALCGYGGIGYTGLARIGTQPTHEWIAITLAEACTHRMADAARVLPTQLAEAVYGVSPNLRGLTLFAAAWDWFGDPPKLRPHFALITNQYDSTGKALVLPTEDFRVLLRVLQATEPFACNFAGQPLAQKRQAVLSRTLRRALGRVTPDRLLRYLVNEVQHTSTERKRVGDKILAMCVPRRSVDTWLESGEHYMLAAPAGTDSATFAYYDPDRRELVQYGPTFICGETAASDVTTTNDVTTDSQSSVVKILRLPKPRATK